MEGGAWSRRSSGNDEGKFREAMGMACSFPQVEEMCADQEKALRAFSKEMIFSSVRTKLFQTHHQIYTKVRSVYKIGNK